VRGREGDPVAPPGSRDAERDREVGLAGPGRSQEHDVLGLGEEVELRQVGDHLPAEAGLDRKVEVVERLR
jgi:hypothetical protein